MLSRYPDWGENILSTTGTKNHILVYLNELGSCGECLQHLYFNLGLSTKRHLQNSQEDHRKSVVSEAGMKFLSLLRLTHYCFKRPAVH